MLTVREDLPYGLLSCDASELYRLLQGPTLIHLPGRDRAPLFVTVLQHGNELTGWEAVRRLLHNYADRELPRPLSLFISNVQAARYGVRHLDEQPDFNRVWKGSGMPEHEMMQQVIGEMREKSPFACIDVHNNSGINPHYACINSIDNGFLHLATLFSRTVVYFMRPDTVMTMAFAGLCPSVTLECGQSGTRSGIEHVVDYLDACLHMSELPKHPVAEHDLDLYHTVAVIKIPENCSIDFGIDESDISFVDGIEQLNFRDLPAGTTLARVRNESYACFDVRDEDGKEVSERFLKIADGRVTTARAFMPSMLTRDVKAIRQDCLCYLMERYSVDDPGGL